MKKIDPTHCYFEEMIRTNCMYVDKTDYIWKMINLNKFVFLSRPRRFGKSLTISTLRSIFEGKKELFEGLKIHNLAPADFWQQYPVIKLDLSTASSYDSAEELERLLLATLRSAMRDARIEIECTSSQESLGELIQTLYFKHNKPVAIFIDEYDNPILNVRLEPFIGDVMKKMEGFFKQLKTNSDKIRFCFITGVSEFTGVSLFSGFNNLEDITQNAEFAMMLGYSQQEIEDNFAEHINAACEKLRMAKEELFDKLRYHYNGFRFHIDAEKVFNPISIGKFFTNGYEFRNYWIATGNPKFLIDLVENEPFALDEFIKESHPQYEVQKSNIRELDAFQVAVQTGYLTISHAERIGGNVKVYYDFPNHEIRESWYRDIILHISKPKSVSRINLNVTKLINAFDYNRPEVFFEVLKWFYAGLPYENICTTEGYFRNILYAIFTSLGIDTQCEVQVATGRVDIVAYNQVTTWIVEMKVQDDDSQTDRLLTEALAQIDTKHYAEKYRFHTKEISKFAVVFDKNTRLLVDWRKGE